MDDTRSTHGEIINAHKILVMKPHGKRPFSKTRGRWEKIKMNLRETGFLECT
jgi:hypothetical protein